MKSEQDCGWLSKSSKEMIRVRSLVLNYI